MSVVRFANRIPYAFLVNSYHWPKVVYQSALRDAMRYGTSCAYGISRSFEGPTTRMRVSGVPGKVIVQGKHRYLK